MQAYVSETGGGEAGIHRILLREVEVEATGAFRDPLRLKQRISYQPVLTMGKRR
jgi:hypothetical protein